MSLEIIQEIKSQNKNVIIYEDIFPEVNFEIKCQHCQKITNCYNLDCYCELCYNDNDDILKPIVDNVNDFKIDIIHQKYIQYGSGYGTLYKHNVKSSDNIFYCVTFCGENSEPNSWSSSPHDDYYYYTIIFSNENNREEEYIHQEQLNKIHE